MARVMGVARVARVTKFARVARVAKVARWVQVARNNGAHNNHHTRSTFVLRLAAVERKLVTNDYIYDFQTLPEYFQQNSQRYMLVSDQSKKVNIYGSQMLIILQTICDGKW